MPYCMHRLSAFVKVYMASYLWAEGMHEVAGVAGLSLEIVEWLTL